MGSFEQEATKCMCVANLFCTLTDHVEHEFSTSLHIRKLPSVHEFISYIYEHEMLFLSMQRNYSSTCFNFFKFGALTDRDSLSMRRKKITHS